MKATTKDTKARKKSYSQKYFSKEKGILSNISFKRAQGLELTEEEAKKETQAKARRERSKERMAKRRSMLKGKAGKGGKAAAAQIALAKEKAKESMRALRASSRARAAAPAASMPPAQKMPQRKKQPAKVNAGRVLKPAGRCPTSKPREAAVETGPATLHRKAALAAREGGRLHLRQLASEPLGEAAPIAESHKSFLELTGASLPKILEVLPKDGAAGELTRRCSKWLQGAGCSRSPAAPSAQSLVLQACEPDLSAKSFPGKESISGPCSEEEKARAGSSCCMEASSSMLCIAREPRAAPRFAMERGDAQAMSRRWGFAEILEAGGRGHALSSGNGSFKVSHPGSGPSQRLHEALSLGKEAAGALAENVILHGEEASSRDGTGASRAGFGWAEGAWSQEQEHEGGPGKGCNLKAFFRCKHPAKIGKRAGKLQGRVAVLLSRALSAVGKELRSQCPSRAAACSYRAGLAKKRLCGMLQNLWEKHTGSAFKEWDFQNPWEECGCSLGCAGIAAAAATSLLKRDAKELRCCGPARMGPCLFKLF